MGDYEYPGLTIYSAAVYQPKGFKFPKADIWDIRNGKGQWIRPREFVAYKNPLRAYRKKLMAHYDARKDEIIDFLEGVEHDAHTMVFCCWCPYERAAQRQLKEWGSFVCHLSVVGAWLKRNTEYTVWLDSDRLQMAVLTQRKEVNNDH